MSRSQLAADVESRAQGRCEYCLMHQALQGATFHVEHIVPESLGGLTHLSNLAWACPGCNLHKGDRLEVRDPENGMSVPVYHPRLDAWADHFTWDDYRIVGISPVGRGTIQMLELNSDRRLRIRQAEERFGLFPPKDWS